MVLAVKPPSDVQDLPGSRKRRGAFFTPKPIAEYLAAWAVEGDVNATVLDPTCGESVFLEAAARELTSLGAATAALPKQIVGVDLDEHSVAESGRLLRRQGLDGSFHVANFFDLSTPDKLDAELPYVDAIIGNPPFVRYQTHAGRERKRAQRTALEQGVSLSGLASSWAALVIHACAFLKPEGRLAMVLPAELLTTRYAEEVRLWLKRRFKVVHLVMFERLQFDDALENVVLVLARGTGGCRAFSLVPVEDASDLPHATLFGPMHLTFAPPDTGKWTDLLLSVEQRQLYDGFANSHCWPLEQYGTPMLGTVTGANKFFCINESTRQRFDIDARHLVPVCPPGTRHLQGFRFTREDWRELRDTDQTVWLVLPADAGKTHRDEGLRRYLAQGVAQKVDQGYKCQKRKPWHRSPVVPAPDLFFTYMSHRYPRLFTNSARVSFLNSMHGIKLRASAGTSAKAVLPLMMLNSATMLGAEIHGRSYGGGILKMEPREAGRLPLPRPDVLERAWGILKSERAMLEQMLEQGRWEEVTSRIDDALLRKSCRLTADAVDLLRSAVGELRGRRLNRSQSTI